jgi:hypothetical protein
MRSVIAKSWRRFAIAALVVGVDVVVSLPIMGATYRPFSWMSIAPADTATLYPVIKNLSFKDGKPTLSVETSAGANLILQRNTTPSVEANWNNVVFTTATEHAILLIDTNPVSRAAYYRVKLIIGGTP